MMARIDRERQVYGSGFQVCGSCLSMGGVARPWAMARRAAAPRPPSQTNALRRKRDPRHRARVRIAVHPSVRTQGFSCDTGKGGVWRLRKHRITKRGLSRFVCYFAQRREASSLCFSAEAPSTPSADARPGQRCQLHWHTRPPADAIPFQYRNLVARHGTCVHSCS